MAKVNLMTVVFSLSTNDLRGLWAGRNFMQTNDPHQHYVSVGFRCLAHEVDSTNPANAATQSIICCASLGDVSASRAGS